MPSRIYCLDKYINTCIEMMQKEGAMYKVGGRRVPGDLINALRPYAQSLKMDISAYMGEGNLHPPSPNRGKLMIYFYAGPSVGAYSGGEEDESLMSAFGITTEYTQRSLLTPSLIGTKIIDGDDNVVAEVVDNTLYILFDLPELDEAALHYRRIRMLEKIMDAFLKLPPLAKRIEAQIAAMSKLKHDTFRNFQRLFRFDDTHSGADIKSQYQDLIAMAKGDVIVLNGDIRVPLGEMERIDQDFGRRTPVGEIYFILRPSRAQDNDSVQIFYLTPEFSLTHDFIYRHGGICMGNIAGQVDNFLEDHEFLIAARSVKLFIENS